jgi:hypothetical protein
VLNGAADELRLRPDVRAATTPAGSGQPMTVIAKRVCPTQHRGRTDEAEHWYRRIADMGHVHAMSNLEPPR